MNTATRWLCVLALLSGVVAPGNVFAHATPINYEPGSGAVVTSAPNEVTIRFSERIELDSSSIKVLAPNGLEIGQTPIIDSSDPRLYRVPIQVGGDGKYTVTWHVVSVDDGHFTKGAFAFTADQNAVAKAGSAFQPATVSTVTRFSEALIGTMSLLGESIFLGVLVLLFIARRTIASASTEIERVTKRTAKLYLYSCASIVMGSGGYILAKTNDLTTLRDGTFVETLPLFLGTLGGEHALYKIGTTLLLVALIVVQKKRSQLFGVTTFLALTVGISAIVYFQAVVSHASASFFYPELSVVITAVHLAGKELLVGIPFVLVGMGTYLYRVLGKERTLRLSATIAALAILVAGVTGTYVTWLHLKADTHLTDTLWGERFISLLLLGLTLGAFRLLHGPLLPWFNRDSNQTSLLTKTLIAECVVGMFVLVYSSYISITTPPFVVESYAYSATVTNENVEFELTVPNARPNTLAVSLTAHDTKEGESPRKLVTTLTNTEKGIGPLVLTLSERAKGVFILPFSELAPDGAWQLALVAERDSGYNAQAEFTIRYPDDIAATKLSSEDRGFDSLARMMVYFSLGIIMVSLVLLFDARRVREYGSVPVSNTEPEITLGMSSATIIFGVLLGVIVSCLALGVGSGVFGSAFRAECKGDGHEWRESIATFDGSPESPNSTLGCFIHDGHFHITSYSEYKFLKNRGEVPLPL